MTSNLRILSGVLVVTTTTPVPVRYYQGLPYYVINGVRYDPKTVLSAVANQTPLPTRRPRALSARTRNVLLALQLGATPAEVAKTFGISRQRVGQIRNKHVTNKA